MFGFMLDVSILFTHYGTTVLLRWWRRVWFFDRLVWVVSPVVSYQLVVRILEGLERDACCGKNAKCPLLQRPFFSREENIVKKTEMPRRYVSSIFIPVKLEILSSGVNYLVHSRETQGTIVCQGQFFGDTISEFLLDHAGLLQTAGRAHGHVGITMDSFQQIHNPDVATSWQAKQHLHGVATTTPDIICQWIVDLKCSTLSPRTLVDSTLLLDAAIETIGTALEQ